MHDPQYPPQPPVYNREHHISNSDCAIIWLKDFQNNLDEKRSNSVLFVL